MGLRKSYATDQGFTAPNAYHKIHSVSGNAEGVVRYDVSIYYDDDARKANAKPMAMERRVIVNALESGINVAHEIYEVLKRNPDYEGAIDVYEADYFPYLANQHLKDAYILNATLEDGYSVTNDAIVNGILNGKVVLNGNVISGTFTQMSVSHTSADGYGIVRKGLVLDGYADGYVVQKLV